MDNKDTLIERKKIRLIKFNPASRGALIPKTFLQFIGIKDLGINDNENVYLTTYQGIDDQGKNTKRYITCERCE